MFPFCQRRRRKSSNVTYWKHSSYNGLKIAQFYLAGSSDLALRQALDILSQWDNKAIDVNGDGFYDNAGLAIFDRWWKKCVASVFEDEFEGYKNAYGQDAIQILSDRYHGYTLFHKALSGKTKFDYFNGRKQEILQSSLKAAILELKAEQQVSNIQQMRLKTHTDSFKPITVVGAMQFQPITSSLAELAPFSKIDRGTENHIINLKPGVVTGVNIIPPGNSGFICQSERRSRHFDDQTRMFINFDYKPLLFYPDAVDAAEEDRIETGRQ